MIAIDNPSLEVVERWQESVETVTGKGNSSYGVSSTQANEKERYARLFQLGMPTYRKDLEGNEVAVSASYQVDCFSTIGLNDLYETDKVSHQAMVDMGFERTFGPELIDNIQTNIKRLTSRYRLLYSGFLLQKEEI